MKFKPVSTVQQTRHATITREWSLVFKVGLVISTQIMVMSAYIGDQITSHPYCYEKLSGQNMSTRWLVEKAKWLSFH